MKYVIALAIFFAAAPAFAFTGPVGVPDQNGCGLGAFPLARWGYQQDRKQPPMFVWFDMGGRDDNGTKMEGRSDTGQMTRHMTCVENKQN